MTYSSCSKSNNQLEDLLNKPPSLSAEKLIVDEAGLSRSKALIKTVRGNVEIKFYPKEAPNTVTRILELIQSGFYDGLTFHRVIPGALVQTGDPTGQGFGGSGIQIKTEENALRHMKGVIAMASKNGDKMADSQFYITLKALPELDGKYTVFGKVSSGLDVLDQIIEGDKIISISIIQNR